MLKTRVVTAIILLLGFLVDLFFASEAIFALVLGIVVSAAAWEWSRLCGLRNESAQTAYAAIVGLLALCALYIPFGEPAMKWILLLGGLFWLSVLALFYLQSQRKPIDAPQNGLLAIGVFLTLLTALSIQFLRSDAPQASAWLLLYSFAVVWVMDIGAYFSGKRFGNNKLALSISPGKTWEGVYGGLLATTILLLLTLWIADWTDGHALKLLISSAFAAGISVVGDLYESRMKRAANVKDSSQILPGHGGVLDRIDGVMAALPVFAFFWVWL